MVQVAVNLAHFKHGGGEICRFDFEIDWSGEGYALGVLTWELSEGWKVFASNSISLIPVSLQPECVNLWYFKLKLYDLTKFIV